MRPSQKAADCPPCSAQEQTLAPTRGRQGAPGCSTPALPHSTPVAEAITEKHRREVKHLLPRPGAAGTRGSFPWCLGPTPLEREGGRQSAPSVASFHVPASLPCQSPPDTRAWRTVGVSWALCLPGRSGCSQGNLVLFPTQEPLRGRVKTLLSSWPFSAPSPPTWSKARILSVPPTPRPSTCPRLSGPSPMTTPPAPLPHTSPSTPPSEATRLT